MDDKPSVITKGVWSSIILKLNPPSTAMKPHEHTCKVILAMTCKYISAIIAQRLVCFKVYHAYLSIHCSKYMVHMHFLQSLKVF